MTDKELNLSVIRQLESLARKVFDTEIEISPGTYSISELAKNNSEHSVLWTYRQECMVYQMTQKHRYVSNYDRVSCLSEDGNTVYQVIPDDMSLRRWVYDIIAPMASVSSADFRCTFPRNMVFAILRNFYSLGGVSARKQISLSRAQSCQDDAPLVVEFDMTADILNLRDVAETSKSVLSISSVLGCVCFDIERQSAVASNGQILTAVPCGMNVLSSDGSVSTFIISATELSSLSGHCTAVVTSEGMSVVTDEHGHQVSVENMKFPNWLSVLVSPSDDALVEFADSPREVAKVMSKFIKLYKRGDDRVYLHIVPGSTEVLVYTYNLDDSSVLSDRLHLRHPVRRTINCRFRPTYFKTAFRSCDGRMYIFDSTRSMMFLSSSGTVTIFMPKLVDDTNDQNCHQFFPLRTSESFATTDSVPVQGSLTLEALLSLRPSAPVPEASPSVSPPDFDARYHPVLLSIGARRKGKSWDFSTCDQQLLSTIIAIINA